MAYDYIICGAGSAGCVLANRLSADPTITVLLIEAGGSDRHPWLYIPKGSALALGSERFTWQYTTQPVGPNQTEEVWVQGKVLGGSSAINGMIYNRGWKSDYDALEKLGNPGWGWDAFVRAYQQIEDHQLGPTPTRGAGGPLTVSVAQKREEVCEAIVGSAEKRGWYRSPDVNEEDVERIGYTPSTIKNGLRVSCARAFLHPVRKRPNLTVVTDTRVAHLLFEGDRVRGVRVSHKGAAADYHASRDVIVSLGAIESPQLLERSGIGAANVLDRAGVALRVESPNVGERMKEHRMITMQWRLEGNLGYNKLLSTRLRQAVTGARYLIQRDGPMAVGYDLIGYFKSNPNADRPNGQTLWAPVSIDPAGLTDGVVAERRAGLTSLVYPLRPTSQGSIHISSPDPAVGPQIIPNYLETDSDRDTLVGLFRRHRELMEQRPIADLIESETLPGPTVETDEQIVDLAMRSGGRAYHVLGTCAMGPDDDDVVDPDLRVRGTRGLRVVDASVLPTMLSGNSNAPVIALAWLAAKRILDERQ